MSDTDEDAMIGVAEAAAIWGVTPATWRGYVHRGDAPAPDDPDLDRPPNRRAPRWRRSTVTAVRTGPVGQGRRTDLAATAEGDRRCDEGAR